MCVQKLADLRVVTGNQTLQIRALKESIEQVIADVLSQQTDSCAQPDMHLQKSIQLLLTVLLHLKQCHMFTREMQIVLITYCTHKLNIKSLRSQPDLLS